MAENVLIEMNLIDGIPEGLVRCRRPGRNCTVFEIPRDRLERAAEIQELRQAGVYILFSEIPDEVHPCVYVGQADTLIKRLQDHTRNQQEWWNVAIALSSENNSLGLTEISYLEHSFYMKLKENGRVILKNRNVPNRGFGIGSRQSVLDEYIEQTLTIIKTLGYKFFTPEKKHSHESELLHISRNGLRAEGKYLPSGSFTVLKGSALVLTYQNSCPEKVKKKRKEIKDFIDDKGILLKDVTFSSPSGAAKFVTASSVNGWCEWKNPAGIPLKKLWNGK